MERPQIDIQKLKFNCDTKFSNLSFEEWVALKNLSKRQDIIIKSADKGGAVVVWRSDLYKEEALRQLSDTSFYAKVEKDLTSNNQKIVKDTIQNLIVKQELPATATNLIITTPRTLCIYVLPKIHKPNKPNNPCTMVKPNFRVSLSHRRSTTVSSETNPLYPFMV